MTNDVLLAAFDGLLDFVLNMDLAQINEILTVTKDADQKLGRDALLRLRSDAFPDADRTRQKALAVVKSYAASHALQGMTRSDYCSLYPEHSFERAALDAFLGFLQAPRATKVKP